jgi:hypothetical protein
MSLTRSSLVGMGQAKVWLGTGRPGAFSLLYDTPTTVNDPHVTDYSIQLTLLNSLLGSFSLPL